MSGNDKPTCDKCGGHILVNVQRNQEDNKRLDIILSSCPICGTGKAQLDAYNELNNAVQHDGRRK